MALEVSDCEEPIYQSFPNVDETSVIWNGREIDLSQLDPISNLQSKIPSFVIEQESSVRMPRFARALKTNLAIHTETKRVEPKTDCEEKIPRVEEQTSRLMEKSNATPLSYVIKAHHPYNRWLGKHAKDPDYISVTIDGVKSRLPDCKSAEEFVQLMQEQQRLVQYGNDQLYESQQRALYLEKFSSKIPPAQPFDSHSYKITYDKKSGKVQVFINGSSEHNFSEKSSKATEHALRFIRDHIGGHNIYIQNTASSYIAALLNNLPPHIVPPESPEYIYHVHKDSSKSMFTSYSSPINGLGAPVNLGGFSSSQEANEWTQMIAGHIAQWLDDHGVTGAVAVSKTMPLYPQPKTVAASEETRHLLLLDREKLAQMEQSEAPHQAESKAALEEFHSAAYPILYPQCTAVPQSPLVQPPTEHQLKKTGELHILDKYEEGELAQSNISAWLRWGANPDRMSLDPKEEITAQHAQLAALSTSIARFVGGLFDFFTNRDRAIHVDINGNTIEVSTLTEILEEFAENAVPYDRTQPGYEMLQAGSDLVVGVVGAFIMTGPIRKGTPNTSRIGVIEEIKTTTHETIQALAKERAFLEEVNQPAYRSGIAFRNKKIQPNHVIRVSHKNPNYLVFCENGKTKVISFADLSQSGTEICKGKGKLSVAGRALQKKTDRLDSAFPKPKGTPTEVSLQGQKVLDEILNHPNKVVTFTTPRKLGFEVIDISVPDKGGIRFAKDGKMIGLLEPKK